MHGRLLQLVTILSLATSTFTESTACVLACDLTLSKIVFQDIPEDLPYYEKQCSSLLRTTSLYVCSREYCPPGTVEPGLNELNASCARYGGTNLPPFSLVSNVTSDDVKRFRLVDRSEYPTAMRLNISAIPSKALLEDGVRTKNAYNIQMETSLLYAVVQFVFWLVVVVFGLGFRFSHFLSRNSKLGHRPTKHSPFYYNLRRGMSKQFKEHILTPAAFDHHCAEPLGWWIVPPRLQSLTILIFIIINFILSFGHYDVFSTNLYWPDATSQYARYVGDRTGVIGVANFTLTYLFATRNNILLWVTGWSFETFIQFHRWVARVSTIQAIAHSVAYTVYVLARGGWQHYWNVWRQRYWYYGAVATTAMSLLLVFSLYPLRCRVYELFLFLHVTLAIASLVGMWYHVEIFDGNYNIFLWPCFFVWIADRILRVGRVLWYNLPYQQSLATYSSQTNVIWVKVPRITQTPQPGSYYFLYLMHGTTWHESHPFTLSGWEEHPSVEHEPESNQKYPLRKRKINLQFVIRPYNGLTARWRDLFKDHAFKSRDGRHLRILVEGPYGQRHSLRWHDTIVFIVGGTGIAIVLSYLSDILDTARAKGNGYRMQCLHIVWAVREPGFFHETFDRELQPRLTEISELSDRTVEIHVQIYITGASVEQRLSDASSIDSNLETPFGTEMISDPAARNSELEPDEHSPLSSAGGTVTPVGIRLSVFNHRPRLENVILRCTSAESDLRGDCAVVACCPSSMADSTRAAVVKAIGQGHKSIDFYPESYAW